MATLLRLTAAACLASMPMVGIGAALAHAEPGDGSRDAGAVSRIGHAGGGHDKAAARSDKTQPGRPDKAHTDKRQTGKAQTDKRQAGKAKAEGKDKNGKPDKTRPDKTEHDDCGGPNLLEELKKLLAALGIGGQPTSPQPLSAGGGGGGGGGRTTAITRLTPKFGDGRNGAAARATATAPRSVANSGTGAAPLGPELVADLQVRDAVSVPPAVGAQLPAIPTPPPVVAPATVLWAQLPDAPAKPVGGIGELPGLRPTPAPVGDAPKPSAGHDQAYAAGNPLPADPAFRTGYTEYLRSAGFGEVTAVAVAGTTGIVALTGVGGLIGYRQARAGQSVRTGAGKRFMS